MTAPVGTNNSVVANTVALPPVNNEVTHEAGGTDVNGSFVMPNGKKYKITRLRLEGQDIIGGSVTGPKQLSAAQIVEITRILNAVWQDQQTQKELNSTKPDSISISFDPKTPNVTVAGRVNNAATDAFTTNSIQYNAVQKFYIELNGLVKRDPPKQVTPPQPQPVAATPTPAASTPAPTTVPQTKSPVPAQPAKPVAGSNTAPNNAPQPSSLVPIVPDPAVAAAEAARKLEQIRQQQMQSQQKAAAAAT